MSILVSGMRSICCHMAQVLAIMRLYSIFNLRLFLSIIFYNRFNLVLKRQTEMVNGTSILKKKCIFYETSTEGTNFLVMLKYVLRL